MKVLLLTDFMGRGGAETHIATLARALKAMHVDVSIASSGGALADLLETEGIPQFRMPLRTHNPILWLLLRRALKKLVRREGYDVLHAHARIPAWLLRGLHVRACKIVTVHARFSVSPILKKVCYWGEYTIAVSEDLRRYVCTNYRIPAEQVRVIPNGIDCKRFAPNAASRLSNTVCVLFASRLDRDCSIGASLLCSIAPTLAARFPFLQISIAGGGNAYGEIKRQADEANRRAGMPVVKMLGDVCDMVPLLQGADIVIGVSRVAMEAAACGSAVILCGNEGYLGILNRERMPLATLTNFCGRGAPRPDAERLQADLISLIENEELRVTCANDGYAAVTDALNAERMGRKTLSLYHRAAHPPFHGCITVGGYFGCGNLGDDAILKGFLEGLHDVAPEIRVLALTGNPKWDQKRFGVRCLNRKNPLTLLFAAANSSLFLCGGGSLLQNATSNRSLFYYLHLIRLFRALGARPVLYSAGIGPLFGARVKKKVARTLGLCSYISLRDPDSYHLLTAIDGSRSRLHQGADPALLLPMPPDTRAAAILAKHRLPLPCNYLCVILKGGRECFDIRRILLASVRMLSKRHGLTPIFLVFDRRIDRRTTLLAAKENGWKVLELDEAADALALLSVSRLTLTMRLHGAILSTVAHTPAISVVPNPYDEKMISFSLLSAQEVIRAEELSVALLVERAEKTLENRNALLPLLTDALQDLRKKAKKDLENIVTMIYNSK